jgi:hypothetical protein
VISVGISVDLGSIRRLAVTSFPAIMIGNKICMEGVLE